MKRFFKAVGVLAVVGAAVTFAALHFGRILDSARQAYRDASVEDALAAARRFPIPPRPTPNTLRSIPRNAQPTSHPSWWPWNNRRWDDAVADAKQAYEDGDYDKAIALNTKALEMHADDNMNSLLLMRRGDSYLAKKDPDKALADYDEAAKSFPRSAQNYVKHALAWHQKGEYDKANEAFDAAVAAEPDDPSIYFTRAETFVSDGALDRALADYKKALELDPRSTSARLGLAEVYLHRGDCHNAIMEATIALKIDPRAYRAYAVRAQSYAKWGMYSRAVAELDTEAKDYYVDTAAALNNVAWCRATDPNEALRDGKQAVTEATRACELRNWKAWSYIDTLAAAYAEAGDFENAMKFEKQAVRMVVAKGQDPKDENQRLTLYEQHTPYRVER